jgi:hypothetical protein
VVVLGGLVLAFTLLFRRRMDERKIEKWQAEANLTFLDEHRGAQWGKLLDVFQKAHGRPAQNDGELDEWIQSEAGKRAIAPHVDEWGKIIPD